MEEVKKVEDYNIGLNKYFFEHDVDGYIFQPDCIDTVLKLLHIIFGEADRDEWISYFCFELEFGKKYKDGDISENGKNIRLANSEDLYDILTQSSN